MRIFLICLLGLFPAVAVAESWQTTQPTSSIESSTVIRDGYSGQHEWRATGGLPYSSGLRYTPAPQYTPLPHVSYEPPPRVPASAPMPWDHLIPGAAPAHDHAVDLIGPQ